MGAIIIALVPILQGLFAGTAINVVLAGLTISQWATIAGAIAGFITPIVEDALKPEVEAAIRGLHPVMNQMFDDVKNHGPQVAASNAVAFDFEKPSNPGMLDFIWHWFK